MSSFKTTRSKPASAIWLDKQKRNRLRALSLLGLTGWTFASDGLSSLFFADTERIMTNITVNAWDGITALVKEIKTCEKAGAIAASVAMAYICIDVMAMLSLPDDRTTQTRQDFVDWVDTYLKAHPDQPYQYRGIEVYGARCAMVHAFGSEADFHTKNPDARRFGYHNGGMHAYNPDVDKTLVIIGTASFLSDIVRAVQSFVEVCQADPGLRARVEGRLPNVLATMPL